MIKLTRIFYNGKEYRGIFCPNDIQTTDLELQVYEFGQIALNTLVADKKLDSFLNDEEKKITVSKLGKLGKKSNNDVAFKLSISQKIIEKPIICIPDPLIFPSINEICTWNEDSQKIFKEEGIYGIYGLKDKALIDNLLWSINQNSIMFGKNRFPTVCAKAAHIWYQIARFQAFNNGNKRTAFIAATIFLKNNFLEFDSDTFIHPSQKMEEEMYYVSKKVAKEQYSEKDVMNFIIAHVKVDFDTMQMIFKELAKRQKN